MAGQARDYQELLESEGRLRAFMDYGPALAFMKDDQFRYVYMNPIMERTFQVALADIQGKADFDWLPESTARTVRENDLKVLESGQAVETFETVATPDGTLRHWMVVKFPFTQPDGRRFVGGVALDVTTLRQVQTQLAESERQYRHLVESAQGLICTHDMDGRILTANRAACQLLDYPAEELLGTNLRDLLNEGARAHLHRYLERIDHRGTDAGLMFIQAKDGREMVWQYHNIKVTEPGHAPFVLAHAQDVTDLRDAHERMKHLAMTDELTGLHNRRGFFAHAARALRDASRHGRPVAAVYVDIDGLKQVNDRFGHERGSDMIVSAADVLKNTFRAADIVARLGGDEFAVLAAISPNDAAVITGRLNRHVAVFNARSGFPCALSLSTGIAYLEVGSATTLEELVGQADAVMYEQKRLKRVG